MNQQAPAPSPPALPVSLAANPKLSSWLKFSSNGQVTVSPGKVEIGQGIVTALAQIAADELDIDLSRVQMVRASTAASPNEGVTSGSLSIQQSGRALRHACAEVRQIFLQQAAERLGVDIDALDIEDGTISGPGNVRTSYWELAEEVSLDRDATPGVTPKIASRRALAGNSVQRIDIPDKVFGPAAIHPRSGAGGNAAWPRAAAGERARETYRIEGGWRPRGGRSRRHRARRQFCRRRQRDRAWRGGGSQRLAQGRDLVRRRAAARRKRSGFIPESPAVGIDGHRQENGRIARRGGADHPAAIYPPLHCPRLDRAILRHGAVERRPRSCLDPQPGRLSPARRSGAGSQTAGREHHRRAYGRRRLLRA